MIELDASIFNPAEARKRLGLSPAGPVGEIPLERGRQDKPGLIVATTMFKSTLPAEVPVHGAIEFGISPEMLRRALIDYEKGGGVVLLKGDFMVNHIPCKGSLRVDFGRRIAPEFTYSVT